MTVVQHTGDDKTLKDYNYVFNISTKCTLYN